MNLRNATLRRVAAVVLCFYVVFLAWVLLQPSAGTASSTVERVARALWDIGFSQRLVTGSRVEFALNALMIAPVPVLATLSGVRWSWERWTAYAFVAAASIEVFQGLVLPARSAQFVDVASNTLGALLGALVSLVLIRVWAERN